MELIHGPIPAETGISKRQWTVECLGKMAEITTGKKDVNEGNPDGEYPFFTCSRTHTFSDSYSFDTESILIAGNGEVGNLHYFKGKFEAYQRTYVAHNFKCDVTYIWHQLNYRLTESLGLGKIGSSIPYIKKENLTGFEFPLPHDRSEQRAIATALSDVDALIAGLERLIAKKRDIKQAAMRQLLTGQTRLPGFSGEWELVSLQTVLATKATYGIVTAGAFLSTGVPMLRGGDIKGASILMDLPNVSEAKSAEYSRTVLEENDVVIALVGYPGESAVVPPWLFGGNISRAVGLLRPNKRIVPNYLVGYLNSPLGRKVVLAPSAGSAQVVVNLREMNKLEIPLPTVEEQRAIASVLTDIDADLTALESRLAKTRAIKQGMMQELLTGRTRLV